MVSTGYNTKMSFGIKLIRFVYFFNNKVLFLHSSSLLSILLFNSNFKQDKVDYCPGPNLGDVFGRNFCSWVLARTLLFWTLHSATQLKGSGLLWQWGGDDFRL